MAAAPVDLKQRLKASYDVIAVKYNNWTTVHSAQRLDYLGRLLALLPGPADVSGQICILELGCGSGAPVTRKLLSHSDNYHVTANDLSSTQISLARTNLADFADRLKLIEGDMMALSFALQSLDVVVGMYSLIHLTLAEQEELLSRIVTWLRPGGYMLVNFAEEASDGKILEKWLDDEGWAFWSGFGTDGTVAKLKQVGLEPVISEVTKDAVDDASFHWVIARRKV